MTLGLPYGSIISRYIETLNIFSIIFLPIFECGLSMAFAVDCEIPQLIWLNRDQNQRLSDLSSVLFRA